MDNHYHLLLETPAGNLSQIMHHVNGAYTTYFNVKRARSGHLFQGRYKAIVVEKEKKTDCHLRKQVEKIEERIKMCNVET